MFFFFEIPWLVIIAAVIIVLALGKVVVDSITPVLIVIGFTIAISLIIKLVKKLRNFIDSDDNYYASELQNEYGDD